MANGQMNRKMTVEKGKPKMNPKVIGRLLRLLFRDYPGKLACVFICIIVNAVVGVTPAVFIETVTGHIVRGLELAKTAGVRYNNGPNTVTFFGALLWNGET